MATASAGEAGWETAQEGRPMCLFVHARQSSFVLPWSLFLYAEGTEAEMRLVFHTHIVRVEGAELSTLLQDLATQSVTILWEPDRTAKFSPAAGPQIVSLSVSENK